MKMHLDTKMGNSAAYSSAKSGSLNCYIAPLSNLENALISIKRYLNSPINGLWYEIMLRDNTFSRSEARASTLYHITLAISQFINHQMK